MKHISSLFLGLILFSLCSCSSGSLELDPAKTQSYYDAHRVDGAFILTNIRTGETVTQNAADLETAHTPASTFKITNSLIGIETGVIPNLEYTMQWDSVVRRVPIWNQDTDLNLAFKNSTVWYYQELATRVGLDSMQYWVDKLDYGNMDISGGITEFWLTGGLKITPKEQINFLKRLIENDLPMSERSIDLVKELMILEETPKYTLRGKTGWGIENNLDIGWFVGYIEVNNETYAFANCIQCDNPNNQNFGTARKEIVKSILKDLILIVD